jgi:AAA+ superfamily predicted ATPase
MTQKNTRPDFLNDIKEQYNLRRKNIILLTGDIDGLFWSPDSQSYVFLEQILYEELKDKFSVIRFDISTGLTFYHVTDKQLLFLDYALESQESDSSLHELIESNRHIPLANMVILKDISDSLNKKRQAHFMVKPLCVIIHYAASLFPPGNFEHLSELDRQRLVFFLNWVNSPLFKNSPNFVILISNVRSEVNSKITELPGTSHIEIPLPGENERYHFVINFAHTQKGLRFMGGRKHFSTTTAGLTLNNIKDILEYSLRARCMASEELVINEINHILQSKLGSIIRIKYPTHTPEDIIGYEKTGEIFEKIFTRCEYPEIAVSAILVSGPNGSGKTYQLEAYAARSKRVVIELTGLRGQYFGETDTFFELLRWHLATFGKVLILVDEAHTAFGSIHSSDTHKTEKRLAGNIIKMMGAPEFLGKVLWGLMTSRPDELDPDIKSRAAVQIPVFDLEGSERRQFVHQMFYDKDIRLTEEEVEKVVEKTDYYSARDYRNLVSEVLAERHHNKDTDVFDVLTGWQASRSIKTQREFQTLIAALHCSYPALLPSKYQQMGDAQIREKIAHMRALFETI